jgi:hypothetical protein
MTEPEAVSKNFQNSFLLTYINVTHIQFKGTDSNSRGSPRASQTYEVLAADVASKQGGTNLQEKQVFSVLYSTGAGKTDRHTTTETNSLFGKPHYPYERGPPVTMDLD